LFDDSTAVGGKRHRIVRVYDDVEDAKIGTCLVQLTAAMEVNAEVVPVSSEVLRRDDGKVVVSLEYDVWEAI
jgi:hypothetical protein